MFPSQFNVLITGSTQITHADLRGKGEVGEDTSLLKQHGITNSYSVELVCQCNREAKVVSEITSEPGTKSQKELET